MLDTESLRAELIDDLARAVDAEQVRAVEDRYLGRRGGRISGLTRDVDFGALGPEERRSVGRAISDLKAEAEAAVAAARSRTDGAERGAEEPEVDLSMPGSGAGIGALDPVAMMQMALEDIFRGMGFTIEQGFEVESERYNFSALNIPPDHPARDMHDTFWLDDGLLLRTHTSASQVRVLERAGPPVRAIFPGRCFRYEEVDASHETSFYQCEGLVVDRGVTVASLLGVMRSFLVEVFEREVDVRLRPGYFPFVEPGFELDLTCLICRGAGCRVCKRSGWVELMPCGMVHPRVLAAAGVDPDEYSGFAFGLGMTRLAMMRHLISDIRLIDAGDLGFSRQFPAAV